MDGIEISFILIIPRSYRLILGILKIAERGGKNNVQSVNG